MGFFSKLKLLIREIKIVHGASNDHMVDEDQCNKAATNKEVREIESYSNVFITIKVSEQ